MREVIAASCGRGGAVQPDQAVVRHRAPASSTQGWRSVSWLSAPWRRSAALFSLRLQFLSRLEPGEARLEPVLDVRGLGTGLAGPQTQEHEARQAMPAHDVDESFGHEDVAAGLLFQREEKLVFDDFGLESKAAIRMRPPSLNSFSLERLSSKASNVRDSRPGKPLSV